MRFGLATKIKRSKEDVLKKQKLKKKSRKVKLLKPKPYDLKCAIPKIVAGVIQASVLRVTHVRENEKHGYKRFFARCVSANAR